MPPMVTDKWFGKATRPKEFGTVTIAFDEIARSKGKPIKRPISVIGLVVVGPTKGRPSAPEPISGLRVSQAEKVPKTYKYDPATGVNAYNTGIPDAEKGHIMALELGGPDIPANIVPQWAKWQGSGEWRKMEVAIKEIAEEGLRSTTKVPYYLLFHAMVGYVPIDVKRAGPRRVAFPSSFTVKVTKLDKVTKVPLGPPETMYDGSPTRNESDDMIALRLLMDFESEHGGDDWDPGYDDWVIETSEKKGKKRNASHFGDDGQNKRYVPIPKVNYSTPLFDFEAYAERYGVKFEVNKKMKIDHIEESEAKDPSYKPEDDK